MMAFAAFLALPALSSWVYGDQDAGMFAFLAWIYMFSGVILILMNRSQKIHLTHRDGILITVLTWVLLSVLGAVPLYFSTNMSISLVDAFFESVSGMTTTGATVLTGLDHMSHGILLWRALLQWIGGMGIIVLAVAVLPFLGVGGLQLYRSEMPGVTKDKLQPRLHETARLLWFVYVALTACCAFCYWLAGMVPFDAITHSFTTLATGGFSNYDASFAAFQSSRIEMVSIIFMLVGAINFGLHFNLLRDGGMRGYFTNFELRIFLLILLCSILLVTTIRAYLEEGQWLSFLQTSGYNVVAILSNTGYSTDDFSMWPPAAMLVLMLLMFVGGCSGSTSGGMKVMRIVLIIKQGMREMQRLIHPNGISHVKMDGQIVPDKVIQSVWAFAGLYITSFAFVSLAMAACGLDLVTAFSAAAASLTNVGPALGSVGPFEGYGHLPAVAKLILCFAMLLGRLELFTILILFAPAFWKK
ncbi:MAG: TrkH family potassium uptake protein [Alphaproteobacteria bacterium]|nr:TrkH family potassium uptake protein [Alphaproteobacteria bacterium]